MNHRGHRGTQGLAFRIYSSAMTSISTNTSFGRRETSTVERAGGVELKYLPYTAFMAVKSFMLLRNTQQRTTLPRPLPAASNTSDRLRRTRSVCAEMSPAMTCCVAGSIAICPEVKMNPLALMAWEYGPMACGASLVEMISRMGSSQVSERLHHRGHGGTQGYPSLNFAED